MDNPYAAPVSAPSTQAGAGGTGLGWLIAGLLCAVATALLPMLAVRSVASIFAAFGSDLPLATEWLVRYHLSLWLLPFALLALRLFGSDSLWQSKRAFQIGVFSLAVTLVAVAVLIYLPVFKLAAAI